MFSDVEKDGNKNYSSYKLLRVVLGTKYFELGAVLYDYWDWTFHTYLHSDDIKSTSNAYGVSYPCVFPNQIRLRMCPLCPQTYAICDFSIWNKARNTRMKFLYQKQENSFRTEKME